MAEMTPVKVCTHCGEVGLSVDTYCLRCMNRGTLVDRYRCRRCQRLSEDERCATCAGDGAIQADGTRSLAPRVGAESDLPDIAKPEPPPWLTGLIGGVVFGAGVGVGLSMALGDETWLTVIVGGMLGGLIGSLMTARR
jgi:hypothetical protein